jgi:hypothetical protein
MNDNVIRVPARSLKEHSQEAQKHGKSSPIRSFGFGQRETGGASRFLVSAPAGISATKKHFVFIGRLGPSSLQVRKVLDFDAGFCAHRATCLKADGRDIKILKLILSGDSDGVSNCT